MLCSTHHPQWGSPELRHSWHVPYCSHDSMGTWVTCTDQIKGCGEVWFSNTNKTVIWPSLKSPIEAWNVSFYWLLIEPKEGFSFFSWPDATEGCSKWTVNWLQWKADKGQIGGILIPVISGGQELQEAITTRLLFIIDNTGMNACRRFWCGSYKSCYKPWHKTVWNPLSYE